MDEMATTCEPQGGGKLSARVGTVTLAQRIDEKEKRLVQELADARRAKVLLDAHPEMEELLSILQRSGGLH